jgi:hypothetical protein
VFRYVTLFCGLLFTALIHAAESIPEPALSTSPALPKIMVLDFDLRDVSALPDAPQEIERTALIDSVIKQTLTEHGYTLLKPCAELLQASKQAIGYLFDRPTLAARLGGEGGADYVLMGQAWKPSYLFTFPRVKLLDTRQGLKPEQQLLLLKTVQLEASTLDKNVIIASARKLATQILEKLESLRK